MKSIFGGRLAVPRQWDVLTVDDIKSPEPNSCRSGPFGSSISSKYFVEEGVPVIRGSNLRDDLTRFVAEEFVYVSEQRTREKYSSCVVEAGDLVFTCWGTIGQVGIIPEDGPYDRYVVSNKQLKLRVDRERVDPLFLFYLLSSPDGVAYIHSRAKGTAVPGINLGILKSIEVAVPPLQVQQDIVRILSAYDDLIENNNRRMDLLEESIHLLYREWFVYLRFPGHERTKIVDGVPEGWERLPFSKVAEFRNGYAFKPHQLGETGLPIVKIPELRNGVTSKTPRYGGDDVPLKHQIENGTLLFSWSGSFVVRVWNDGDALLNQHLFQVRPYGSCSVAFLEVALRSAIELFTARSVGTTMKHIRRGALDEVSLLVPPEAIMAEFDGLALAARSQRDIFESLNQRLREARDLLLPRLMDGRIPV